MGVSEERRVEPPTCSRYKSSGRLYYIAKARCTQYALAFEIIMFCCYIKTNTYVLLHNEAIRNEVNET